MLKKSNPIICSIILAAALIATGCSSQPNHPNQLNSVDGATYDSLTAAHGALVSLRAEIAVVYPKYAPVFDEAAAAYGTAFNAYALFRRAPSDQAALAVAMNNLTVSIVNLENRFAADMHATPQTAINIRRRAEGIRAHAQSKIKISDILTELEIAAAVAQTIPQAEPYAVIAGIVIQATSSAVAAVETASGQPIDLGTIQPVPSI
jgi:hypothetical protein